MPQRRRRGFTLIELLVVIAIIAILIALLVPAVQKVREAAARTDCRNRMKQLVLALHSYHDANKAFPPGNLTSVSGQALPYPGNASGPGWTVLILPFIEETPRFQSFNSPTAVYNPNNTFFGCYPASGCYDAGATNIAQQLIRCTKFECPSDPNSNPQNANCNYAGVMGGWGANSTAVTIGNNPTPPNTLAGEPLWATRNGAANGILYVNSSVRMLQITDGTSNVYVLGETRYLQLQGGVPGWYSTWASSYYPADGEGGAPFPLNLAACYNSINTCTQNPAQVDVTSYSTNTFGSWHPGGCHMAMADGSIQFVAPVITLSVFQQRGIKDDGLPVGGDPSSSN